MKNAQNNPTQHKSMLALWIVAAFLVVVGIVAVVLIATNSSSQLVNVAAQEVATEEEEESNEPELGTASTEVINLMSLMGLSSSDAITQIGHGASVQDQETLSSLGFSREVSVLLTDETGDSLSGTPTVTLGLNSSGKVEAASYEVSTSLLGYGDLSFASAVEDFHIVEFMLEEAGLTGVKEGSVTLPDQEDYSYYESDRKTLSNETYTFSGTNQVDDQAYSWEVTLDYDYSEANEQSNLGYTVRKVTVAIMKA